MTSHEVALSEICDTGSGGTPSRAKQEIYYDGSIPWVKSGELRESVITETGESITELGLKESSAKLLPADTLLVALYGATVGRVGMLGIEAATNQAVCYLIPDDTRVERRYLYHALRSKVPYWLTQRVGGGQPNISQGVIKNTKIPLPPLSEQKRIAEILDRAEALRAKRRAALALLDELTQSILARLLDGSADLGTTTLGNISRDMHQGINTVTEKIEYQNDGFPIIQSKHTTQGYLDLSDARFVSKATYLKYKEKYRPARNDLLLCNIGTIGKSLLMEQENDFLIAWNLFLIKLDLDQVSPSFCKHYFDRLASQHYFDRFLTGGTVKFISKKTLNATPIPLPSMDRQREFEEQIASVEVLKEKHRSAVAELDQLFASLQHRAFRGELS
ncbi:restriction endonuclease subunit S [Rhodopirellula baltica]|uniref:Restriction modification system S chain homolog n=1 Tax=Rhodopirellula baltica (strain DSM 10527 / NCIMB 13988 / SH1) TaxID=243090 RepID=Q7UE18_RHOBA|nr:restriction endonuclease subunit S [Rhodopirellula baltica]CAD79236.1 restriction modification system S chain homolog [Rhodopirellula baltica SH 1]